MSGPTSRQHCSCGTETPLVHSEVCRHYENCPDCGGTGFLVFQLVPTGPSFRDGDSVSLYGTPKPIDLEAIRGRHLLKVRMVRDNERLGITYSAAIQQDIVDFESLLAEVERLHSKRWAYFSAPQFYPSGGMQDCVSRHATEAEALAAMGNDPDGEVVDLFAAES